MAPAPSLPHDVMEEVLLRVRADDPASLVRAALASKRWRRLVTDPAFRRRRLDRHGPNPPMLGFLSECEATWTWTDDKRPFARFVPMSTFSPPGADHRGLRPIDARHGRVLLQDWHGNALFVVWDPVTGHRVALPSLPPWSSALPRNCSINAAVLCADCAAVTATGGTGTCAGDHHQDDDCHRRPFVVVLVGTNSNHILRGHIGNMFACTYSSESAAWSSPTTSHSAGDEMRPGRSAVVGNALFLKICTYDRILKYDLRTHQTSVLRLPRRAARAETPPTTTTDLIQLELVALEHGRRLGFLRREEPNKLCLWSRDGDQGDDGRRWTLRRVIDVRKLFPLVDPSTLYAKYRLVGAVDREGACAVAFMAVQNRGLFTVDMESGSMNLVSEDFGTASCVVPYIQGRAVRFVGPVQISK